MESGREHITIHERLGLTMVLSVNATALPVFDQVNPSPSAAGMV